MKVAVEAASSAFNQRICAAPRKSVCGPGSIEQAHKPDEFIALDQIDQCLVMLDKLTAKLTG